jgi:transposase-like protein
VSKRTQEFSIPSLAAMIATEADAYRLLEELRWGNEAPACPKCGTIGETYYMAPRDGSKCRKTRTGSLSQRRVWKCRACRKQFSVLTDTIFHGTKIPVRTWLLVIFDFCASKNSVSAWEISRRYDMTNESAWHMLHRIREAMKREPLVGLLRGTVIADETWIGGKPSNMHADKREVRTNPERNGRVNPHTDKQPVMAIVDFETREVRSRVVADVTGATLTAALKAEVDIERSQLWTDESASYRTVGKPFNAHKTVNHSAGQYKNHGATTNYAEGFFSQLKRSLDGTHHAISVEHLDRYLAQFDFMYSLCKMKDSERMRDLIGSVDGRRLTMGALTGG